MTAFNGFAPALAACLAAGLLAGPAASDDKAPEAKQEEKTVRKAPATKAIRLAPVARAGVLTRLLGGADPVEKKDFSAESSHQQIKAIDVSGKDGSGKLQTLCLTADDKVVALVGQGRYNAAPPRSGAKPAPVKQEIHVYDADGKLVKNWTVDFKASAVNVAPSGNILVAGDGRFAFYDASYQQLAAGEIPHLVDLKKNSAALRTKAEERRKTIVASYQRMVDQFAAQAKKKAGDSKPKPGDDDEEGGAAPNAGLVKAYTNMLDQAKKKSVDDYVAEILGQALSVNGICASDKEIFLVCGDTQGYGYSVWRYDPEMKGAKETMKGLSGCCGQMDVQCCDGNLVVAENTKHRVAVYDRDGKLVRAFGRNDREGKGDGFGSCCNPMNTRPVANGEIYTAESEGFIKRFDKTGKFLGLVAEAKLTGGCKNVAVAASKDGTRVYFCDLPGSRILYLAKKPAQVAAN